MELPGQPPYLIPITVEPKTNLAEFVAAAGEAVSKFGEYLGSCNVQDHGGGQAMGDDDTQAMSAQYYEKIIRKGLARGLSEEEATAEARSEATRAEARAETTATVRVANSKIHLMNAAQEFVRQAHKSVARPYDMSDTELTKRIVELLATTQREAANTMTRLRGLIDPAILLVADSSRHCEAVLNDIVSNFVRYNKRAELAAIYGVVEVDKYIFAYITAILEFLYNIATVNMINILLENRENELIRNMVGSFLYFECDKYYKFLKDASNKSILDHILSIILKLQLEDILNITLAAAAAAVVCPTVTGYTITIATEVAKAAAAGAVEVGQAVLRLDGTGLLSYYDFLGRYLKIAIPIIYGVRANSGLIQIGIDKLNDAGWRLNEMVSGVQRPIQYGVLLNRLPSGDSFITRLFGKVPPMVKATMSIVLGGVCSEYISAFQIFPSKPGTEIKKALVTTAKALKRIIKKAKSPEDIISTKLADDAIQTIIVETEKIQLELLKTAKDRLESSDPINEQIEKVSEQIHKFCEILKLKCGVLTVPRLALLQAEITASDPAITCQLLQGLQPTSDRVSDSPDSMCAQASQSEPPDLEDIKYNNWWNWLTTIFDSNVERDTRIRKINDDPDNPEVFVPFTNDIVNWLLEEAAAQARARAEAEAEAARAEAEAARLLEKDDMGGGRSRSRKRSISKLTRRKGVAKKQKSKKNKRQSRRKSCRSSSRKDRK